jgi:hypothetical protein
LPVQQRRCSQNSVAVLAPSLAAHNQDVHFPPCGRSRNADLGYQIVPGQIETFEHLSEDQNTKHVVPTPGVKLMEFIARPTPSQKRSTRNGAASGSILDDMPCGCSEGDVAVRGWADCTCKPANLHGAILSITTLQSLPRPPTQVTPSFGKSFVITHTLFLGRLVLDTRSPCPVLH